MTDEETCKRVATALVYKFETRSMSPRNGVPHGCWTFTGSTTISFNTNSAGSDRDAWNDNVTPVCSKGKHIFGPPEARSYEITAVSSRTLI